MFEFKKEQIEQLEKWKRLLDKDDIQEWYTHQKEASKEFLNTLERENFREKDLSLDTLYGLAKIAKQELGSTQLGIRGPTSIFETNGVREFNERLRKLYFGKDPLFDRILQFLELKRVRKMTMSQFLCMFEPKEYPFLFHQMPEVFENYLLIDQNQLDKASEEAIKRFNITPRRDFSAQAQKGASEYFAYFVILQEIKKALNLESYFQL